MSYAGSYCDGPEDDEEFYYDFDDPNASDSRFPPTSFSDERINYLLERPLFDDSSGFNIPNQQSDDEDKSLDELQTCCGHSKDLHYLITREQAFSLIAEHDRLYPDDAFISPSDLVNDLHWRADYEFFSDVAQQNVDTLRRVPTAGWESQHPLVKNHERVVSNNVYWQQIEAMEGPDVVPKDMRRRLDYLRRMDQPDPPNPLLDAQVAAGKEMLANCIAAYKLAHSPDTAAEGKAAAEATTEDPSDHFWLSAPQFISWLIYWTPPDLQPPALPPLRR